MDETFNDDSVYFIYTDKENQKYEVQILEELEYGEPKNAEKNKIIESTDPKLVINSQKLSSEKLSGIIESQILTDFSKHIRDNQTNISYDRLFGHYLEEATEYQIQDPYIRMPHQFRDSMKLCSMIHKKKSKC